MGKKPEQTVEQREKRTAAYELFLKGVLENGQRASLRGIAMTVGVTQTTVRYWRDKDRWEERVDAALTHRTVATTKDNASVENLMRSGFYQAIQQLQRIIEDGQQKATTRVRAIMAYGKLCKDFNVITPSDLKNKPADVTMGGFKDDLPHATLPGTATEEAGGVPLQSVPASAPFGNPDTQSGADGEWMGRGEPSNRARSLLEGSRVPGGPVEWSGDAAERSDEEEDGRNGGRSMKWGLPANDTVLHDPDDDEIGVSKCPECGRFWDGLSCDSCKYGVIGASPIPEER